jgi:nitrate reductase NapE component
MNETNQPMDINPDSTPTPAKKNNNTVLIIAIIVIVVLCCCCIAVVGGYGIQWLWNNGDRLLQQGTGVILQMS